MRVTDFMPSPPAPAAPWASRILRLVEGLSGELELEAAFRPTFDYARAESRVDAASRGAVATSAMMSLSFSCPEALVVGADGVAPAALRVRAGERIWLAIGQGEPEALVADADEELERTLASGRGWSSRCAYEGPYEGLVRRSALVLQLLTYGPTGAVVAAPTTSLPEEVGGSRNWDYRFTWLRDAALTLHALQSIGYHEEAMAFWDWVERVAAERSKPLRILYSIDGGTETREVTLDHFEGDRGSRPVRIGNAAASQVQLDVYGEVIDAASYCYRHMRMPIRPRPTSSTGSRTRRRGSGRSQTRHLGGPRRPAPLPLLEALLLGRARPPSTPPLRGGDERDPRTGR